MWVSSVVTATVSSLTVAVVGTYAWAVGVTDAPVPESAGASFATAGPVWSGASGFGNARPLPPPPAVVVPSTVPGTTSSSPTSSMAGRPAPQPNLTSPVAPAPLASEAASRLAPAAVEAAETTAAAPSASLPSASSGASAGATGDVRVAHANLRYTLSPAAFAADLTTVVSSDPDLVSLNEVSVREIADLRRAGYDLYRPTSRRASSNAVLWRTDRWRSVDQGHRTLVDSGPRATDAGRAATYVTLESLDGGRLSFVSTHHMVNPRRHGPDRPLRERIYAQGMTRLVALVDELSTQGPVLVAGDFNATYQRDDGWGPRRMLRASGLRSAMEVQGVVPTHDGGGTIDYVFYPTDQARPTSQRVTDLRSDHDLIVNDFTLTG